MASLTTHLRQVGDHGRLGFHPACPVCCEERLAGALPSDALAGRRTPAVLAAGLLAFSSASPTVVFAQEGGQDQELTSDSTATSAPDSDVEAGPSDTDESDDPAASVDDAVPDGTGPVGPDLVEQGDPEDAADAQAPATAAPPAPTSTATPAPRSLAPAAPTPVSDPATAPGPASTGPAASDAVDPSTSSGAPRASSSTPAGSLTGTPREGNARKPARARVRHKRVHLHAAAAPRVVRTAPAAQAQAQPALAPAATAATAPAYVAQQAPAPVVVRHAGRPAKPGDRVHVVFAGESLWSIAQDVLGHGATVGQVAREVDRLWTLNRGRIGTGDRDLLPIGARLELR